MNPAVSKFLTELDHPRKAEVSDLYSYISSAFPDLDSEVKWNAPSFKLRGTNVLTFRLFPAPVFQIILHLGSKRDPQAPNLKFDLVGLEHKWADTTRCVITVTPSLDRQLLADAVGAWTAQVSRL